jgi:AcrR family transcriptional regulator
MSRTASTTSASGGRGHPRSRRTQVQRRTETQGKLLDATVQSVLDVGYSGTTIRRVAALAGVSQGAATHHFPRRVDLVGAAVERLAEHRIAELEQLAGELPAAPDQRVPLLLDVVWADFSSSTFTVFVKLWVAAADDEELYASLVPVERRISRAVGDLMGAFAGDELQRADLVPQMQMAMAAVRGLALTQRFEPTGRTRRNPWPPVRAALLQAILSCLGDRH